MKQVTVYLNNGERCTGTYDNGKTTTENYAFFPGDLCIVDPPDPRQKKHRGRIGKLNGKQRNGFPKLCFMDEQGSYTFIDPVALSPLPSTLPVITLIKSSTEKMKPTAPKNLPPKIPETQESLQRAICLLGNRTKAELRQKLKEELQDLIGAYPNLEQAANWKKSLKQLIKQ